MIHLIRDYIKRRQKGKQDAIDLCNDFINQTGMSRQTFDTVQDLFVNKFGNPL